VRRLAILLSVLALLGAAHWYRHRPLAQASGVLAESPPRQSAAADRSMLRHGEFELLPLADFSLEARVLSRQDYRFDAGSALAPTDLALGWGRMSDSAVIGQLEIAQSARFYTYRWRGAPPIPAGEIVRSSANMHLIPADAGVARTLARVRVGEIVALRGHLVEARGAHGWRWTSSLRRDDRGDGACELVLVDAIAHSAHAGSAALAVAP
jgi:hypothetical protein